MEEYARCKKALFAQQKHDDWIVIDANSSALFPPQDHPSSVCIFGASVPTSAPAKCEAQISENQISMTTSQNTIIIPTESIKLLGTHNKSNIAAALLALQALNIPLIPEHIYRLTPLVHRLEQVASALPVCWINDSKATNIEATDAALNALKEDPSHNTLWVILGGAGKEGAQYALLSKNLNFLNAKVICFGDARLEISKSLKTAHLVETLVDVFDLLEVELCADDTVLFSPACASFDQYRNFEERGEHFKQLVSTHLFTLSPEST